MIEALFFGSKYRYAWHRVRFVILQQTVQIGVRYLEWISFKRLIGAESAFFYILVRHLFEFLVRYRWASLENMRQELQTAYRAHQDSAVSGILRREWSNAFFRGGGAAVIGAVIAGFAARAGHASPIPLLIAICGVRFASDVMQRTLRSFIYVTGRVYRPIWTMSGLDILHGGLLYWIGRKHGVAGVLGVTFLDAALRTGIGWKVLFDNYRRSRFPRLSAPRWRWLELRPSLPAFRAGIALPGIEAAFLVAGVAGFSAFKEWDEFGEYTQWLYLITPLWFSAIGFYMIYYVDFLKFRGRVFRGIRSVLFFDSIRALGLYSLFAGGMAAVLDQAGSDEPIGRVTFPCAALLVFSWGFFGCSLARAFVQGRRESLILISILTAVAATCAWDPVSLGAFLIGAPLLSGLIGILLSNPRDQTASGSSRCSPFAFLHRIKEGAASSGAVQGILLDRSNLGFSVALSFARLEAVLPPGSAYALFGRSHLWWHMPDSLPFSAPELFGIFGANWTRELGGAPEVPPAPVERVSLWSPGDRLDFEGMGLREQDLRTLWRSVRSSVEGGGMKQGLRGWRYRPDFTDGVWTGGRFVRRPGSSGGL